MKRHANLAFFVPHLGCPYQCVYCDQKSISGQRKAPDPEEIIRTCNEYLPEKSSGGTEIAFFGGSFTAIDRRLMISLLDAAKRFLISGRADGIRISTRPDYVDEEVLSILSEYGVTSIELGAQSMDDAVLKKNGRGHDSSCVVKSSHLIKSAKFSLGLQMMVGMYGTEDPGKDALYTAERFAELQPDTVRIYPTIVVDGTPLAELYRRGLYRPLDLEEAVEITAGLISLFRSSDITVIRTGLHYEDSLVQNMLAGPYHPAFGELCESLIFRKEIEKAMENKDSATVRCEPRLISQVTGQKKSNIIYFEQLGKEINVVPDRNVKRIVIE